MFSPPSPLGAGDGSDLAWLDLRAEETSRNYWKMRDDFAGSIAAPAGRTNADLLELFDGLEEAQRTAFEAKRARDDAYAAVELALEPSPMTFASLAERDAWYDRMRDQWIEATARIDAARAAFDSTPQLVLPDDATPEQMLAIMDADEVHANRRDELLLEWDRAEKDQAAAAAVLRRLEMDDE